MSQFTDMIIQQGNYNQEEIIKLLKSIDDKLTYLCGPEYKPTKDKNAKKK